MDNKFQETIITNIHDYVENEIRVKSYDELMADIDALNTKSAPDKVDEIIRAAIGLSTIEQRRIHERIRNQTGIPFGTLKQAAKDAHREGNSEPDHLELARTIIDDVGSGNIISAKSSVYQWFQTGVWKIIDNRTTKQIVQARIPLHVNSVTRSVIDSVADVLCTEIHKPDHEFNIGNSEVVNCLNGEITLVDGCWKLQSHIRENYRTSQIPVEFIPDATAPRFLKFLDDVFNSDDDADDKKKAILEMIGYTLMAHCQHERFIILVGSGANGKSVLLATLEAICVTDNVAGVQPSQFDRSFQRAHLHNKLANIVTEVKQGEVIDDASLKGIVSGEPTTVEHKFKSPFDMRPFATCWFGTNHMPHTRDFSDALFRRALVVQFNNVFKPELGNCDPRLREKLISESSGILTLALNAYSDALKNGFTMPRSCMTARDEWRLEADQVAQFVDENCQRDVSSEIRAGELFDAYKGWAINAGVHRTLTQKSFRERLTKLDFGQRRDSSARYVTGIRITGLDTFQSTYKQYK